MTGMSIEGNFIKLAQSAKAKPTQIRKGAIRGIDETTKYGVNKEKAITNARGYNKLFKSIDSIKTGEFSRAFGPMMNERYPVYVEKGRGPIYPKLRGMPINHSVSNLGKHIGASALRFLIGGKVLFRKSVGPAKARPYVQPTHADLKIMYPRIMETEINRALKR